VETNDSAGKETLDPDLILSCENVRKNYGGTAALRGVRLRIRRGDIHALVGENGAGKSTLMNILVGLV